MELLYMGLFWTICIGALVAVVVAGLLAGGVANNRLESIAIDMSSDQDSLSKAKDSYYPSLSIKSVVSWLTQRFGYREEVPADEDFPLVTTGSSVALIERNVLGR